MTQQIRKITNQFILLQENFNAISGKSHFLQNNYEFSKIDLKLPQDETKRLLWAFKL